jgi:hypothetical protein
MAVQPAAFILKHPHNNFDSRITHTGYTCAVDLSIGIGHSDNHPGYTTRYYHVTTWWRLSIMRTWLQRDIHCRSTQQMPVTLLDRPDCIDLSMRLADPYMIPFANHTSTMHNQRTHHGVGRSAAQSALGELETAAHILKIRGIAEAHLYIFFTIKTL